jgi:hypothetical protein
VTNGEQVVRETVSVAPEIIEFAGYKDVLSTEICLHVFRAMDAWALDGLSTSEVINAITEAF